MNGSFDPITLVFLVAAVFVILRLRSVLGKRTGNERPPMNPYPEKERTAVGDDNVVPLPGHEDAVRRNHGRNSLEDAEERIKDFLPGGGPVAEGLLEIARQDASFDPKTFLGGSKTAYEMIVTAFAEGNKKTLKNLLSRDVYEGFLTAVSERDARGEVVDSTFIGINKADIIEAQMRDKTAHVTVKFVSQLITAIRNKHGEVIDGDPKQVREVTDIWTFAREVKSRNPNWKLVATQAAN